MKCKECSGKIKIVFGWRSVTLCCMECNRVYTLDEYVEDIDDKIFEHIAHRSCDRI